MTALKPHVAINVNHFETSLVFYKNFFGLDPVRTRPGYAKFDVQQPPLNFTINQRTYDDPGALNHLGLQVNSTDDVLAAKERLMHAGLATFDEMNTNCCYARQDKIWATDPDGNRWEVFVVIEEEKDSVPGTLQGSECAAGACCSPS